MPRKSKIPVTSILAKNIKRLRNAHGWTQRQLAERIGHEEPAHISQMERGIRGAGVDIRKKLCEVFGVEEGELFRSESEWGVARETTAQIVDPEDLPFGVPHTLGPSRAVRMVGPSREEVKKRLIDQLDKIMDHPLLETAIASNLAAFSKVAEYEARIAALEKELEELRLQVKLLSERAMCEAPVAYADRQKGEEQSDGGQP